MAKILSTEQVEPLADLNTTPLIDVLLVLLVMFIITIPLQTHAVKIDLPAACPSCPEIRGDTNTITVDAAGQVAWNETAVSMPNLRTTLLRTQRMDPVPELHLLPDRVLAMGKSMRSWPRSSVPGFRSSASLATKRIATYSNQPSTGGCLPSTNRLAPRHSRVHWNGDP